MIITVAGVLATTIGLGVQFSVLNNGLYAISVYFKPINSYVFSIQSYQIPATADTTVVTDTPAFKMTVKVNDVKYPTDLKAVYFIREEFNLKGEQVNSSTYEFFLTSDELKSIGSALINI